jgi:hypothetical protein
VADDFAAAERHLAGPVPDRSPSGLHNRGQDGRGRPQRAVLDLDGDAKTATVMLPACAIDPFGAVLCGDALAEQRGLEHARAGHEVGVRPTRLTDQSPTLVAGNPGEQPGQPDQWRTHGRGTTSIDTGGVHAAEFAVKLRHGACLQRTSRIKQLRPGQPDRASCEGEQRMLAGAVVKEAALFVRGEVGPTICRAGQRIGVELRASTELRDGVEVLVLGTMRCPPDRDLRKFGTTIGPPRLVENVEAHQRLHGLDRRTQERGPLGIAVREDDLVVHGDHDVADVRGLDQLNSSGLVAPGHLNESCCGSHAGPGRISSTLASASPKTSSITGWSTTACSLNAATQTVSVDGGGPVAAWATGGARLACPTYASRMQGDLRSTSLEQLCRALDERRATGELAVRNGAEQVNLWFREGRVVRATSSGHEMRLGDRLVHGGLISAEELQIALTTQRSGSRHLGEVLVESGAVSRHVVRVFIQEQVLDATFGAVRWTAGEYLFSDVPVEASTVPCDLTAAQLMFALESRHRVWDEITRTIPELAAIPEFVPGSGASAAPLEPGEASIVNAIDGSSSLQSMAVRLGFGHFEVATVIYGLTLLGLVRLRSATDAPSQPAVSGDPTAQGNPVLLGSPADQAAPAVGTDDDIAPWAFTIEDDAGESVAEPATRERTAAPIRSNVGDAATGTPLPETIIAPEPEDETSAAKPAAGTPSRPRTGEMSALLRELHQLSGE